MDRGDVEVLVAVDDAHPAGLAAVSAALADAGLRDPQLLSAAGVVTGRADSAALDALRAVDGVAAVDVSREFRLPPPDAPIQ